MSAATLSPAAVEGLAALRAVREGIAERLDVGAEVWRGIPQRVRVALLMLALDATREDPRDVARRPWRSFTDAEREKLGSVARTFAEGLRDVGRLR